MCVLEDGVGGTFPRATSGDSILPRDYRWSPISSAQLNLKVISGHGWVFFFFFFYCSVTPPPSIHPNLPFYFIISSLHFPTQTKRPFPLLHRRLLETVRVVCSHKHAYTHIIHMWGRNYAGGQLFPRLHAHTRAWNRSTRVIVMKLSQRLYLTEVLNWTEKKGILSFN